MPAPTNRIMLTSAILLIFIIPMAGAWLSVGAEPGSEEDTPHPASMVFLESGYVLRKSRVEAYDQDLTFYLVSWTNQSKNYTILVDGLPILNGTFSQYKALEYRHPTRFIRELLVIVDNETLMEKKLLVIFSRSSYGDSELEPAFMGFTLSEWDQVKWDVFWGVIVAGLLGVGPFGKAFQYYYRKYSGEEVIVSTG